ncbi:MAG: hypothetical protein FJ356_00580 [Thaumarchaeota archaeon]|nr:hypothetical protein [Nitrososphaerota archaeon]
MTSGEQSPVTKWDKIPFFTYPLFLLVLIPNFSVEMGLFAAIVGITVTSVCKLREDKVVKKKIARVRTDEEKQKIASIKRQYAILATLYGLIAALALTTSLDSFATLFTDEGCIDPQTETEIICFDKTETLEQLPFLLASNPMLLLVSFFAVGILYYHCGIAFFATEAADLVADKKKMGVLISSFLLFLEGLILYFAAYSIDSVLQFSLWIAVLMAVDITWVLINIRKKIDVLFQWIHFGSIVLLFLFCYLQV